MIPYSDNQQIVVFFNKAQNKIAQLGSVVADEEIDTLNSRLLLDLSDFLESLDSPYNTWKEIDIIRYIHFWNKRAGLNNLPFIQMTGYDVTIRVGNGDFDFSGLEALIREIMKKFPHNSLAKIQGGNETERYHISKEMYEWILCQMPKSQCPAITNPTVGLGTSTNPLSWPSGYYELGTSITLVNLQGSVQLNSGKKVLTYRYLRNNLELPSSKVLNPVDNLINSYQDRTVIKQDASHTFEATFEVGGTLQASKYIQFRPPMFYGVLTRNQINGDTAITLTKDVRDKGYMELSFKLPDGNTELPEGSDKTAVMFFPAGWGEPSSIKVLDFDFKPDWTFVETPMKLQDDTTVNGILAIFKNQAEGDTTFKFSF